MSHSKVWALMPSISDMVLVFSFLVALSPNVCTDFWWHLESGEQMVLSGRILTIDPFSHTASGRPWVSHEWLSEVIFYIQYVAGGINTVLFFKALVAALTIWLIYKVLLEEGVDALLGFLLVVPTISIIAIGWSVRPHIFTYLFLALFVKLLFAYRKRPNKTIWVLPLITVVWVNLHGGFIIGIAFLALFIAGEWLSLLFSQGHSGARMWLQTPVKVFLTTLAAALINPHTYNALIYPAGYITCAYKNYIAEWTPTQLSGIPELELLLVLTICAFAFSKLKKRATDILLFAAFFYLAMSAVRHVPLFVIVATPIIAPDLHGAFGAFLDALQKGFMTSKPGIAKIITTMRAKSAWVTKCEGRRNAHIIPIACISCVFVILLISEPVFQPSEADYPLGAVEYLKSHKLQGNMFNEYGWGGYLIWSLYPDYKVFIDGRADVYGDEIVNDYADIAGLRPGWVRLSDEYNISFFLVPKELPISQGLELSADFIKIFEDNTSVIMKRR